jgi:hypothetical protein
MKSKNGLVQEPGWFSHKSLKKPWFLTKSRFFVVFSTVVVQKLKFLNNSNKYITAVFLLCAAAVSFLYSAYRDRNKLNVNGFFAPVIVNMELDKHYMNNYCVTALPGNRIFNLVSADMTKNSLQNTVIYTEIREESVQKLFIKCYDRRNAVWPIDNITVFNGNRTYYFPKDVIHTWEGQETEGGTLLELPLEPYAKSVIKPWINWYGDLNFILKEISAFLANPFSFTVALVFILVFVSLFWPEIGAALRFIRINHGRKVEISLLLLLIVFSFLLRINGLTRHSSWSDELYSSTIAANPHLPLSNTFKDPGNPPLFYLLLRLWHEIFGWSEASGRMLSVFLGLSGIVSLYFFVKAMCGRKYAFLAAFMLAINPSHIGYSNEIRAYILQMALVPLTARLFFTVLGKGSPRNYALYVLAGSALVNAHYFGVLLILFNFIYYVFGNRKRLFERKTVYFTAVNAAIALSLLPFFAITAFQTALMNKSFNTWISKPGKRDFIVFLILLLFCSIFPLVKRLSGTVKKLWAQNSGFLIYAIYAGSFIFILTYIVSLKRPILTWRYLSVCLPLLLSIPPIVLFGAIHYGKYDVIIRCILFVALLQFSSSFKMFGGGSNDVYKEAQEYICADAKAHSLPSADLNNTSYLSSYYGFAETVPFTGGNDCDVVYINPLHKNEAAMSMLLSDAGLDGENVLKIRTSNGTYIWKKYLSDIRRDAAPHWVN